MPTILFYVTVGVGVFALGWCVVMAICLTFDPDNGLGDIRLRKQLRRAVWMIGLGVTEVLTGLGHILSLGLLDPDLIYWYLVWTRWGEEE